MKKDRYPQHIAIIMDGNGRWAKQRGKRRTAGHEVGAERVRSITTFLAASAVKCLTLYAFSTENWARPRHEVEFLMKLLERYLQKELPTYLENDIRFETIGDLSRFSSSLQERIAATKEATRNAKALTQALALNYGSQDEIVRAAKSCVEANREITAENIGSHLDTAGLPPLDMLIRTGGDMRLSNFLLWQAAYAELFFTQTLWPDFDELQLSSMIEEFAGRERRFGKVEE